MIRIYIPIHAWGAARDLDPLLTAVCRNRKTTSILWPLHADRAVSTIRPRQEHGSPQLMHPDAAPAGDGHEPGSTAAVIEAATAPVSVGAGRVAGAGDLASGIGEVAGERDKVSKRGPNVDLFCAGHSLRRRALRIDLTVPRRRPRPLRSRQPDR